MRILVGLHVYIITYRLLRYIKITFHIIHTWDHIRGSEGSLMFLTEGPNLCALQRSGVAGSPPQLKGSIIWP